MNLSYFCFSGLKENPSTLEKVLMLWMFTLATEEFREFITILERTFRKKLKVFFNDRWNFVDIIAIVLFLPGLLIRFQTNTGIKRFFVDSSNFEACALFLEKS